MMDLLLAIDIGGTKLAVGAARPDEFAAAGKLRQIIKEPIAPPGTPEAVIPRILEHALALRGADERIGRIGIAIGGPLDHASGLVLNFPHLPGWQDIPLPSILSEALGAPAILDNDANLGALAEHRFGAGRGSRDMVYITLSTGIGGGVIVDNRLVHGVRTSAGEVGHVTVQTDGPRCACGNRGCLERMASGRNIARAARELLHERRSEGGLMLDLAGGDTDAIMAEVVQRAAAGGDRIALQVWEKAIDYMAIGIGSIVHVLAPETIVLGGGVSQAGEFLLEPLRRRLADHVHYVPLDQVSVVRAELGHDSAIIGAGVAALGA